MCASAGRVGKASGPELPLLSLKQRSSLLRASGRWRTSKDGRIWFQSVSRRVEMGFSQMGLSTLILISLGLLKFCPVCKTGLLGIVAKGLACAINSEPLPANSICKGLMAFKNVPILGSEELILRRDLSQRRED